MFCICPRVAPRVVFLYVGGMAKYSSADGVRGITGEDGYGWLPAAPGDRGQWVRIEGAARYELEKRKKCRAETGDTGWYLYDNIIGGYFGEWCGSGILEAVDAANTLIELSHDH